MPLADIDYAAAMAAMMMRAAAADADAADAAPCAMLILFAAFDACAMMPRYAALDARHTALMPPCCHAPYVTPRAICRVVAAARRMRAAIRV